MRCTLLEAVVLGRHGRVGPGEVFGKGRFWWPAPSAAQTKLSPAPETLALLIGGIDLKHGSLKPWYER